MYIPTDGRALLQELGEEEFPEWCGKPVDPGLRLSSMFTKQFQHGQHRQAMGQGTLESTFSISLKGKSLVPWVCQPPTPPWNNFTGAALELSSALSEKTWKLSMENLPFHNPPTWTMAPVLNYMKCCGSKCLYLLHSQVSKEVCKYRFFFCLKTCSEEGTYHWQALEKSSYFCSS